MTSSIIPYLNILYPHSVSDRRGERTWVRGNVETCFVPWGYNVWSDWKRCLNSLLLQSNVWANQEANCGWRPARGLVGSASASVLVGREFSTLGRVLPRPYKLVLQPSCQAHGVRKSCREHINIPSKMQPEIVRTQSWCYKTIAVIKHQHQTTI